MDGLLHWIEDYTIISELQVVWLAVVQPSLSCGVLAVTRTAIQAA
jgi:hypothetical protein